MFAEVPVLPVVVPLAVAVMAFFVWHMQRRGLLSFPRVAVALALCVYVAGILANTLFPIYLDKPSRSAPWHAYIDVTPLVGYEVADAVMNICVFVPLGVLLALALPRWTWWRVLAAAAMFSLGIELSQYVTAHLLGGGHIADINDFVFNVVGAALGCGLLSALTPVPHAARLIDRFRWA
ncbi:VanZ family protein [Nocardioides sp. W7]|uniref:VanZ family protein n=1 Tax=Nocardioides sp. W7 TaxID=2931390 RepID=UPI001FD0819F|nr:VanZ family protein [Nocardioides sp. W7]